MTDILDRTTHDRASAKDVADWCARSLAEAKEAGAFDTRCFVQNADLIVAALRECAAWTEVSSAALRGFADAYFQHREDCADPHREQGAHRIPVDCPRETTA